MKHKLFWMYMLNKYWSVLMFALLMLGVILVVSSCGIDDIGKIFMGHR
ncbi:hypothetical protein [Ktedonosporobacter rubrisoli]|nr:hypothetical protein [Ktedonosporobacter rubrisoli]